ncbi:MAG: hypothetical protein EOO75_17940, partial [Myxococcales bacterium]
PPPRLRRRRPVPGAGRRRRPRGLPPARRGRARRRLRRRPHRHPARGRPHDALDPPRRPGRSPARLPRPGGAVRTRTSRVARARSSRAVLAAALGLLAGCGGPLGSGYLTQAAEGQFWLLRSRRPVTEVAADQDVDASIRTLVGEVPRIKQYGESQGLTPNRNYTSYVDVGSPAVTWVVSACEPLRFKSTIWKFPIIGAITYVGWFDRAEADEHGAKLRARGLDVDVRGAGAYSTLGWLPDPVLSSMLYRGDGALGGLVDVVLHESVHATYYLNGQSYLNESLAMFVAGRLTRDYFDLTRGPHSSERAAYERDEAAAERRRHGLHEVYNQLDALYQSPLPDADKLAQKTAILADAQRRFGGRGLNNAVLIQYRTYGSGQERFEALYQACGGWPRFWDAIRTIDKSSFASLQQED